MFIARSVVRNVVRDVVRQAVRAGYSGKVQPITDGRFNMPTISDPVDNRMVQDHENNWHYVPQEALRVMGARPVENILPPSHTPYALFAGATITQIGDDEWAVEVTANSTIVRIGIFSGGSHGGNVICGLDIKSSTPIVGGVFLEACDQGRSDISGSIAGAYKRFTTSGVALSAYRFIDIEFSNSGNSIVIKNPMLEDATGRADTTTPSEYVSVGVLSAPYHGANADGFKYFFTENGNTVSSNVVTEGTGAALTTVKGYFAEGAATEVSGRSADIGNWPNATTATVAQDAVGLEGIPNTAFTVTDNSNTVRQSRSIFTNITGLSGYETATFYAPYRIAYNASPSVYPSMTFQIFNGGTTLTHRIVFDPSDGTYVTVSADGFVLPVVRSGDFWFVTLGLTNNNSGNTFTNVAFDPAFNTNGSGTADVSAQGSTAIASAELYMTNWSYSPILTTGGTPKTRLADTEATIPGSFFSDGVGSIEFALTPYFDTALGADAGIINSNTTADNLLSFTTTAKQLELNDGTNAGQLSSAWSTIGQTIKVKACWNSNSDMDFSVDGTSEGGITFDGSFNPSGDITLFKSLTQGAAIKSIKFYSGDLGENWLTKVA